MIEKIQKHCDDWKKLKIKFKKIEFKLKQK